MGQKIVILKGLPASGKSTYAKKFAEENPTFVRVNRDDIRHMSGMYWYTPRESYISDVEEFCVESAIKNGFSVILDATNFNPKVRIWVDKIAQKYTIEVSEKIFYTPLEECIQRDKARENSVGKSVIIGMYKKYFKINNNE